MPVVSVSLMNVPGTEAAVGRAGGMGLGFNGAQLLALPIGGCFCNDLRYLAHRRGLGVESIAVKVHLTMDGDPLIATGAEVTVQCTTENGSDPKGLIDEARDSSMVGCSLPRGISVVFA